MDRINDVAGYVSSLCGLDDPVFDREASSSCSRVDAQLAVDRGEMSGDRAMADDKLPGDLGNGEFPSNS